MKRKRGRRLELRTTQKTSMRTVAAAGSAAIIALAAFLYINFSGTEESKANDSAAGVRVTYQTTDAIVPARLLLKPHPDIKKSTGSYHPKADSAYRQTRYGRSIAIQEERYLTQ